MSESRIHLPNSECGHGHGHSHEGHGHGHSHGESDLRKRSMPANGVGETMGVIFPFTTHKGVFSQIAREMRKMATQKHAKLIFAFIVLNLLTVLILTAWTLSTDSMALTAYMYLVIFDLFALLTCLMSVWVEQQSPSSSFSFGYERFEVLAVFSSTMLAGLGAFFVVKECFERIFQQPQVHTARLVPGALLVFMYHQLVTYTLTSSNRAFNHVISASSSSWLQEHVSDMCEGFCQVVPGLSKILLPRINPFVLLGFAGGLALFVTDLLIDMYAYHSADSMAAMVIAFMTFGTMFPMAAYSGKILLQTMPSHVIGQLDKCLREAGTLDGVLEFRNEHFWTLAFGKMAGSLHVRVRRDADEQMVLAHVTNRLSNLVQNLTIQVFKDDWTTRTSVYQMLANSGYGSKMPGQSATLPREGSPIAMYRPLTPITANINSFAGVRTEFNNPLATDFRPSPMLPMSQKSYAPRMNSPAQLASYGALARGAAPNAWKSSGHVGASTTYNPTALAYANSLSKSKYIPPPAPAIVNHKNL